jgi:hypothetical protein
MAKLGKQKTTLTPLQMLPPLQCNEVVGRMRSDTIIFRYPHNSRLNRTGYWTPDSGWRSAASSLKLTSQGNWEPAEVSLHVTFHADEKSVSLTQQMSTKVNRGLSEGLSEIVTPLHATTKILTFTAFLFRQRLFVTCYAKKKKKKKAIPVTGIESLWGCEMLRIPHCLDNRLTVNCEILATCSSTYCPVRTSQEAHSVSIK